MYLTRRVSGFDIEKNPIADRFVIKCDEID